MGDRIIVQTSQSLGLGLVLWLGSGAWAIGDSPDWIGKTSILGCLNYDAVLKHAVLQRIIKQSACYIRVDRYSASCLLSSSQHSTST